MPGWDNTPRRGRRRNLFHGATPELYELWLREAIGFTRRRLPPDRRLVFINAWNEWEKAPIWNPTSGLAPSSSRRPGEPWPDYPNGARNDGDEDQAACWRRGPDRAGGVAPVVRDVPQIYVGTISVVGNPEFWLAACLCRFLGVTVRARLGSNWRDPAISSASTKSATAT